MMISEIKLLTPEIILLTLACIILVADTVSKNPLRTLTYWLSQLTLTLVLLLLLNQYPSLESYAFNNTFVTDQMGAFIKATICIVTLIVFFYSREYTSENETSRGEYYVLGLFAVLGMMVMASAASMLTVYLGLELLSLSLYAMVAMHGGFPTASEAAMKYFVLGALASGMLLYGISILYGVTGTFDLQEVALYTGQNTDSGSSLLLVFGLVFIIVGVAFKLGAVPFHMWVPDVYEGSPVAVTLFVGTAPKIAAFSMAIRLLSDGMQPLVDDWQGMLVVISILSMAAGNIIAIAQSNIKRMLAYSTIAHIGFILLGIISGTRDGYAGAMFYVVIYAVMSMGSFGMIILLSRKGFEADKLDDFKGLASRSPWFAFIMLILMFSLAGVPPMIGFWSKWFVIREIIIVGHFWLAVIAVMFSVIGAYYYLRIIKLMYFDKLERMIAIKSSPEMRFVLSVNGIVLLLLGFMPGLLMAVCIRAMAL